MQAAQEAERALRRRDTGKPVRQRKAAVHATEPVAPPRSPRTRQPRRKAVDR
jgi:hypothetical protein